MPCDLIPDPFPILRGGELTLRELAEEDLPAWFGRLSDREATTLAGDPVAASMQDVIDGLAFHQSAFRNKEGLRWAIVPSRLGTSVGSIGLDELSQRDRSAALGAAIGRAHWGHGIATRAARLVLDYGFSELSLEQVDLVVLPENSRVMRVLHRLGFVLARDPAVIRPIGERTDTLVYHLNQAAWCAA